MVPKENRIHNMRTVLNIDNKFEICLILYTLYSPIPIKNFIYKKIKLKNKEAPLFEEQLAKHSLEHISFTHRANLKKLITH